MLGAALGMQAFTGVMGMGAAKQEARNMAAWQREVQGLARESADLSFAFGTRSLARQESQDILAVAMEDTTAQREFLRSFGTARAVSMGMGVEGGTVNAALDDYVAIEAGRQELMNTNQRSRAVQRTQDFAALGTSRLNQINQFSQMAPVSQPNTALQFAQIASGMLATYSQFAGPIGGNNGLPRGAPVPQAAQTPGMMYQQPVMQSNPDRSPSMNLMFGGSI